MNWNQESIRALRLKLAFLIPAERDVRSLIEDAGLDPAYIDLSGAPVTRWYEVLSEAKKQLKLDSILARAIERYPQDEMLIGMSRGEYASTENDVTDWRGAVNQDLEKIIGTESTLVPISFLERGLKCARSVARIRVPGSFGTGFLIARNIILTNNHVIRSYATAQKSWAEFDVQTNVTGQLVTPKTFQLDPDSCFETSEEHDWTIVGVKGNPSEPYGFIQLEPVQIARDEFVQIIQHPQGGEKQLAYRANIIAYVDSSVVQYLTDTLPGSSGSPVFNREWRVVALHHAGGNLNEPNNSSMTFLRNEGININTVLEDLHAVGFQYCE
ncbi:MAG: trypsin-like peptidase domain-containing protein [Oscillatoriophycideae cyanobacterium NC_groundwater_1537_Pr4_S-0.65um_50_18]|nr:trypsin-like peptidase domain-containing protein [Oscillatoriophycideae cyanobacterium NC_groundwater_1537_Pr4_S-0.65um_50_18]